MMLDYDPLSADVIADPYPVYSELRSAAPVFWSERLGSWVLTSYEDCRAVIGDTETFASDWRRAGHDEGGGTPSMQSLDPPEHTPVRRLFTLAYRAQDLDGIGLRATEAARSVFERLADAPEFDFTAQVARPVALRAVCELLGVEPPPVASFAELSDALVRGMDAGLVPEVREPALAARVEITQLLAEWAAAEPKPGLIADVLAGARSAGVPDDEVWSNVRVLFLAGFSTTVAAAVNAVLALLQHPEALGRMRAPGVLETGVDELLRYDGPVQGTTRACVTTTVIGGVTIERGDLVMALFGAANRDPARFEAPDELRVDRTKNRHLSLGWGPHACTGASLARIIIRSLVTALLDSPATPRLAAAPWRAPRATLRYPDRLPMTFLPVEHDA
ncbi:cytochrome P450 [Kitasatospora sp. NPDC005856]|uniref:cytochrome P450 n=1 Tax=Kitasatospora sp. NPDC005856 TaxID=3154566 RepID=UPI0033E22FC0